MTYTHIGYRPHTGYCHIGKDANHYSAKAGKVHALNASGAGFLALCGETVAARYTDWYGIGDDIRSHVKPATDGSRVTCARCRKLLGLQKFAVQTRNLGNKWYSIKDNDDYATKAEAEAALARLQSQYAFNVFRVRRV